MIDSSSSLIDRYVLGREIGRGAFAVVKRGTDKRNGQLVAVKCYTITDTCQQTLLHAEREISIMTKLEHPNCCSLLGVHSSDKCIYVVMECLFGGELFQRLADQVSGADFIMDCAQFTTHDLFARQEHYSEREAAACFVQIVSAIEYLHSKHICHR